MMIRNAGFILLLGLVLGACSDSDNVANTVDIEVMDTSVSGGGVKGPLIDASAEIYELDIEALDLKGALVSSGTTNERAELQDITLPGNAVGSFLLEITANENTIDLTSGAAPLFVSYRTVISSQDIENGRVYATPVTTLALDLAIQSRPFASMTEFDEAKAVAAQKALSTLGFGLDSDINPFTSNPLLTNSDTTDQQQADVLAYRTAIEGLAAIIELLRVEIVNGGGTVSADEVLTAVAMDLSDDVIDGQNTEGAIDTLMRVTDVNTVVTTDPAMLMVPGTNIAITMLADVVTAETETTGVTIATEAISTGRVSVVPVAARSEPDIDNDGVSDRDDAFPGDATETLDTDGDGTGNNSDTDDDGDGSSDMDDAFPLDATESLDTDGNGVGNNTDTDDDGDGVADDSDALPLDASETIDTDGDGTGNNADTDDDGDGSPDDEDMFPLDATESVDTDGDGTGNNTDTDDDGDGVADVDDNLPLDPRGSIATSSTIGAAGGSIISPDGLMTLTIPPNAIAEDTVISIGAPTAVTTSEFDTEEFPIDGHYLLEPDGLQFSTPVDVVWTIPATSSQPNNMRLVYTRSNGVIESPAERVVINPDTGTVSAKINHFSDVFIGILGGLIVINQPSASTGNDLIWNYVFDIQDESVGIDYRTEGTAIIDDDGTVGITRQPELIIGESIITSPTHDDVFYCEYREPANGNPEGVDCTPSNMGNISATCLTGSAEGLRVRMGFNIEGEWAGLDVTGGLFPGNRGLLRVEADGFCRDSVEITEPRFISIGNEVDRITEAPESLVPENCGAQSQPYSVVVSNTRTTAINTAGTCSQDLNFDPNNNSIFGALALVLDTVQRLFIYGESGVFIIELVDGIFGELSDFQSTTTDIQYSVNDDGSPNSHQAYSVNNNGQVKLRTLLSNGSNTNENIFSAFGATGRTFHWLCTDYLDDRNRYHQRHTKLCLLR